MQILITKFSKSYQSPFIDINIFHVFGSQTPTQYKKYRGYIN
jgi:hypothetical protein